MRTRDYKKYVEYDDIVEYKRRFLARTAISKALANDQIKKPKCCQLCKQARSLDAHHIDYGKPLDVKWLCKTCHGIAHTEGHALNPDCNEQTGRDSVRIDKSEMIRVNFTIPVDEYLELVMDADKREISIACRLRQILIESKLDKNERDNDKPQPKRKPRISRMESDETSLPESEFQPFSKPRREWLHNLHGVGGRFRKVLPANGADANGLQRAGSAQ